jgi:hypothetical protein
MRKNLLAKILRPMWLYDQVEEPRRIIIMLMIVAPLIFFMSFANYPMNLIPLVILWAVIMYRIIYMYIMVEIKNIFKGD